MVELPVSTKMDELHQLLEATLTRVPQLLLEKRLAEKFKAINLKVTRAITRKAALHILGGSREPFKINGNNDNLSIQITDEDIEFVVKGTERFHKEQLEGVLRKTADDTADLLYKSLLKRWPEEFKAQQQETEQFRERRRWGKGLAKLRTLLTIVREWAQGAYERRQRVADGKVRQLEDVMLRLHVRACQVTHEIIVLLENGLADGAMARWRTLHEITIVAAIIAKFGDEVAERYKYYQIVESFAAIKAYERDHKGLGFKAPSKRLSDKIRRDHASAISRFGEKFGEEYGWAAHHLKIKETERLTFARLEKEAGNSFMRSPYKMASYNVHASPKGVYFKLGSLGGLPGYIAGASNAGLANRLNIRQSVYSRSPCLQSVKASFLMIWSWRTSLRAWNSKFRRNSGKQKRSCAMTTKNIEQPYREVCDNRHLFVSRRSEETR